MKWLKELRIGKNELIADVVFLGVAMILSAIALFIFDIHWSFYPGNDILPPSKHIFTNLTPYYIGIPLGGIIGFFLIKILAWAFIIEEDEHLAQKNKSTKTRKK